MTFIRANAADLFILVSVIFLYAIYAAFRKRKGRPSPGMPSFGGSPWGPFWDLRKGTHSRDRISGLPEGTGTNPRLQGFPFPGKRRNKLGEALASLCGGLFRIRRKPDTRSLSPKEKGASSEQRHDK